MSLEMGDVRVSMTFKSAEKNNRQRCGISHVLGKSSPIDRQSGPGLGGV